MKVYPYNKHYLTKTLKGQVCKVNGELVLDFPWHEIKLKHIQHCTSTEHGIALVVATIRFMDASDCPYPWMKDYLVRAMELARDIQLAIYPFKSRQTALIREWEETLKELMERNHFM